MHIVSSLPILGILLLQSMPPMSHTDHPVSRVLITAAAFVVVAAGLKAAQAIVVPFLISLTLALIFSPLLTWLIRRRLPAWLAILTILLVIMLLGSMLGAILGNSINDFISDLPNYQERLQQLVSNSVQWLNSTGLEGPAQQAIASFDPGAALRVAGTALKSLTGFMTNAFLIMLTTAFLLGESLVLNKKIDAVMGEHRGGMPAFEQIAVSIQNYMGLKTLISLGTGLVITLWLAVLGVDYPVMWGLLAFLLNYIPNVGSLIAAIPAVLFTVLQLGLLSALFVGVGYFVVNTVLGSVVEPKVMGRGLNLSPLVVFISLIFWGYLFGPTGMLLSVPLTVIIKLILENVPSARRFAILLGGAPAD